MAAGVSDKVWEISDMVRLGKQSGGKVAGDARRELERKLRSTIVSRSNFLGGGVRKKNPQQLTQAPGTKPSKKS